MKLRKPLLAGQWYPGSKYECEELISSFRKNKKPDNKIFGGIVPHAGWIFSGEIASHVIEAASYSDPDVVVVFGMHMHPGSALRIMARGGYETPLGPLMVDEGLAESVAEKYSVIYETPENFEPDNTIEVQLPFIKYFMGDIPLLCVGLPPDDSSLNFAVEALKIVQSRYNNPVIIGSTDLTHYGPAYGFMPFGSGIAAVNAVKENDAEMIKLFETMDSGKIIKKALALQNACCPGAAAGAVAGAQELGAVKGVMSEYGTSYEKAGGQSFVGYAGVCFE
jgi:AmmeMemoRadiSam system protein B